MRRFHLVMLLSLVFLTLLSTVFLSELALVGVSAQEPATYISPNPSQYTAPEIGHSFTVDINVTDVATLAGVGAYVWYNTSILDAVECTAHPDAANLAPLDPVTYEWIPINDTLGQILFGFTFWPPKTGNYTLITINFTATGEGAGGLVINGTSLVDAGADEIPHTVIDGSITVGAPSVLSLISLNPIESTVFVGAEFTMNVSIADVTSLQNYEFKLWYNTTILNSTDVIPGPINPPGTVFIPDPLQNVSDGFVHAGASLPAGQAFTGNGTMMTISFNALAAGNCTLNLTETMLTDSMEMEINHVTLDGYVTVMPKTVDFHTHHINDGTDDFPNDYAPMIIPVNGKNVMISPFITCTTFEDDVWKPNHHPCKLAQTLLVDDDWSDMDANYTYIFEDWTDYDWNDIVVSLYAVNNNLTINAETCLKSRDAAWKNPFGVEITPMGMSVEIHWNSIDYPEKRIIKANSGETVDIELFSESDPCDTAFLKIIPSITPTASFVYSPLHPQVCQNVTFNASASTPNSGHIVSFEWDFGDASLHELGMIVTHHYAASGTYNVTLNVTDSTETWDTETKTITVISRIPPPVGGHSIPIEKLDFLAPKIDLIPGTSLAFVLLAATVVTIILIRRGNKTLRWGR